MVIVKYVSTTFLPLGLFLIVNSDRVLSMQSTSSWKMTWYYSLSVTSSPVRIPVTSSFVRW